VPARSASGLRESTRGQALRRARTCYDHLAGGVGVAINDSLQHRGMLQSTDDAYQLTQAGEQRVTDVGALELRRAFGLNVRLPDDR